MLGLIFASLVPYPFMMPLLILEHFTTCASLLTFLSVEQSHLEVFSAHGFNLSKYWLNFQALGLAALPMYVPTRNRKFCVSYLR